MAQVDLNLIRTFLMLHETGSVTLTAEKLHVTQPSISYALNRLRELFDDRLFVRTAHGMEPTTVARQLYPSLKEAMRQINDTIDGSRHFTPERCKLRFRLALTDLGEMALLPAILKAFYAQAPQAELDVVPLEIDKAREWLTTGKVNAVICSRALGGADIDKHVLLEDRYVCLLDRQGGAADGDLSIERFVHGRHVSIASSSGHDLVEEVMAQRGIERKVSLSLSHFSVLPQVLQGSDLIAILPLQIAARFADARLRVHELPFAVPSFEVALHWHAQPRSAASQRWFCATVIDAVTAAQRA
ncbi:LysR family transcriptional regulator [Vreelandella sp. GE22]